MTTTLLTPEETAREANLVAHIAALTTARDEAATALSDATALHEAAAKGGDPTAAMDASKAMRRHRAELRDAEADLQMAEVWLAELRAVVARRRAELAAKEAREEARAAVSQYVKLLNAVRQSVEARVDALADMVEAQRGDFAALRAAKDAATGATERARALSGGPALAADPLEQTLDRALRGSETLTRGWRVPPGHTAPAMLNAMVEAVRAARPELR
ncbi:hypothetical protein [Phycicoccus sp. 3266]|uniref:hypothetical protein n=1 Tax=Phycicoccus sp. 3266 TaxID=2817751 RepID=UPI00285F91A6|nr:hypothetical protein [Phycicoccus sp. 3266]MDR6862178.1 chromosome segregation ATPase [Phycicoccus sp. 3266]